MPPDFIAAVQALQPGQTSAPVLTRLGWHVIHLMERRPSRLPAYEEARAEILAALEAHILASDL
jgi:peptidyl-prolyl cis-trans isomerase C